MVKELNRLTAKKVLNDTTNTQTESDSKISSEKKKKLERYLLSESSERQNRNPLAGLSGSEKLEACEKIINNIHAINEEIIKKRNAIKEEANNDIKTIEDIEKYHQENADEILAKQFALQDIIMVSNNGIRESHLIREQMDWMSKDKFEVIDSYMMQQGKEQPLWNLSRQELKKIFRSEEGKTTYATLHLGIALSHVRNKERWHSIKGGKEFARHLEILDDFMKNDYNEDNSIRDAIVKMHKFIENMSVEDKKKVGLINDSIMIVYNTIDRNLKQLASTHIQEASDTEDKSPGYHPQQNYYSSSHLSTDFIRPYPGSQETSSQIEASVSTAIPIGIESNYHLQDMQQSDITEPSGLTQELHMEYQKILSDFNRVFPPEDKSITRPDISDDQVLSIVKKLGEDTNFHGAAGMRNETLSNAAHSFKQRSKNKSQPVKEQGLVMMKALRWLRDSFIDRNYRNPTRIDIVKKISRELEPLNNRMEQEQARGYSSTEANELIDIFSGKLTKEWENLDSTSFD